MLLSIVIAAVLIIGAALFGNRLPMGDVLLGGHFYQVIAILLAIVISAVINIPMFTMMRANTEYKKGHYKKALALYKKAFDTKRLSPDMDIFCGYIALKEGQTSEAERVFNAVAKKKLSPRQKASLDGNVALLTWKQGDLDGAIELLRSVWSSAPSPVTAGSLGALLLIKAGETGDYSEAKEFCEKTNNQYSYDKTIMCNLLEACRCTGEYERAGEIGAELMDMRPETPAAYYQYALTLQALGKDEEAEETMRKALRYRFTALTPIKKQACTLTGAELDLKNEV